MFAITNLQNGFVRNFILNNHALNLIKAHLVAPSIVKLRRTGRGVVRHARRFFERPAVLQIGGDAGRAEALIADLGGDAAK